MWAYDNWLAAPYLVPIWKLVSKARPWNLRARLIYIYIPVALQILDEWKPFKLLLLLLFLLLLLLFFLLSTQCQNFEKM